MRTKTLTKFPTLLPFLINISFIKCPLLKPSFYHLILEAGLGDPNGTLSFPIINIMFKTLFISRCCYLSLDDIQWKREKKTQDIWELQEKHLFAEKTAMIKCKCRHNIQRERKGRLAKEIFTHASMAASGTKADPMRWREGRFVCSEQILCILITHIRKYWDVMSIYWWLFPKMFRNHIESEYFFPPPSLPCFLPFFLSSRFHVALADL